MLFRNVLKLSCGSALRALSGVTAAVLASSPALAALSQPVRTEAGLVQGAVAADPAITVYKGIRYAAAPIGAAA